MTMTDKKPTPSKNGTAASRRPSPPTPQTFSVEGASGAPFELIHKLEVDWWEGAKKKYLSHYSFDNIADVQDLDRLLFSELLAYRYGYWLANDGDYDNNAIPEKETRDSLNKTLTELRLLKKHMGMDRRGRIESQSQSVADYLSNLKLRAKEFGIHRNNQIAKAIDLFSELETLVGLHDRCDEQERAELGVTEPDIMNWVRETAIPEFNSLDDAFRKEQRYWIREVNS
jgi:hypothetical protein